MKKVRILLTVLLSAAILAGAWIVFFHSEWIKPQPKPEAADPETNVAVHTVKISRATLHRYIECYGTVIPAPHRIGDKTQSSSARLASPVAGVVSEVLCAIGQRVETGAPLFQLDDRLARSDEAKQEAALLSAQASYNKLKSSIRPEQLAVAQIAVDKARQAVRYAEDADARQKALAHDQLASEKQLQDSAQALAGAKSDLTSAEKQWELLKNSPAPDEIAEAEAKIGEAEKALAASRLTRALLTIKSPLSATVVKLTVNPGESVDTTTIVAELVDLTRLEVSAPIPVSQAMLLKTGQPVEIHSAGAKSGAGDEVFKGQVAAVGLQADMKTDATTVYAALPPDSGLRPGQSARLKITVEEHSRILAVPEESVFKDKVGIPVIAMVEDGKSSLQNVDVGLSENGLVEIGGKDFKEGDTIVSAGAYGLPEETKVHVINSDAPAPEKK